MTEHIRVGVGEGERPHNLPLRQYHVTEKKRDKGNNTTEPSCGISAGLFTRRKLGVGAYLPTWRHIWEDIYPYEDLIYLILLFLFQLAVCSTFY